MPVERRATLKFDPASSVWIGLRLVVISNRYVTSLYSQIDDQLGLQRDDVAVLACLSITDATTAQEIVRYTGRPKNSVSRAVTGLEASGFLSRAIHPHDGRAATLAVTAKGRRAVKLIGSRAAEHDGRMMADLNEHERQELTRLLNIIGDSSLKLAAPARRRRP